MWYFFSLGGMDVLDLDTSAQDAFMRATMEAESHRYLASGEGRQSCTQSLDAWHSILGDVYVPYGNHASLDLRGGTHVRNER